jgi:hypothetical protein
MQLGDQRIGVLREAAQPVEGEPRLGQEGGQGTEDGLQVAVPDRRGAEDHAGIPDQALELALALAERPEDLAGVADQLLDGALLGVQDPQHAVCVLREGLEVGDRGGEVGPPARGGDRELLHPGLERRPCPGVEGPEDLVELHRGLDLCPGQGSVLRQLRSVAVSLGELDVGLAQQRLLPQHRPGVGRDRRVAAVDLEGGDRQVPVRARVLEVDRLHLADRDVRDADVRLDRELGCLVERDVDPVALRLQRNRAAEGRPEEEQEAEAGEGEGDCHRDLPECRSPRPHEQPGILLARGAPVSW